MENKNFRPLTHQDLELKQQILVFARDLAKKQGFENGLASAMIYSSFAEYISENLLESLKYFIYQGSYNQYAGIIFINETNAGKSKKTIGQNIGELERYNFPDKEGILDCLRKITQARNNMLHQFAKSNVEGLNKIILQDVLIIQQETETLVQKIDTVYAGLQKILNPNIMNPVSQNTATQQNIPPTETPQANPSQTP